MKSFDDLDKNIDKYYERSLDGATSDRLELKAILDKMSLANHIEDNISVPIDISSIVEKGQQIRLSTKLRKATFKFLLVAILFATVIGVMSIKLSISVIMVSQFGMLIVLLIVNSILLKQKARREVQ
ncbi:hypothetical protein [Clostridium vincentii]|uniref:Uncharacterized protein n=1 Tax=Clostridium vincentii TaxID=52704 RepID=A0A2T0BIU6_9CLOT|nr:hypothetical protein [Clostridium vincentii]PRR83763.1 hypothetical protein CLVI_07100 [Clostridium vincentii]